MAINHHRCNQTSLTWFQFFLEPLGSFFHLFTSNTQALQMSPTRSSDSLWNQSLTSWCINSLYIHSIHTSRISHIKKKSYTPTKWMNERLLPKTQSERLFISTAVCEAWTGGLGLADATAVVTPVDLWLVKAKHSLSVGQRYGKKTGNRKQKDE